MHAYLSSSKDPLETINNCVDNSFRAVLGYRASLETNSAHFTVLVNNTAKWVVVHDPGLGHAKGKNKKVSHDTLLKLMEPNQGSEIAPNIFIVVANQGSKNFVCDACNEPIPNAIQCPSCKEEVPPSANYCFGLPKRKLQWKEVRFSRLSLL